MTSKKAVGHIYRLVSKQDILVELDKCMENGGLVEGLIVFDVERMKVTRITTYTLSEVARPKKESPFIPHHEYIEDATGRLCAQILPGAQLKRYRTKGVYWTDQATFGGQPSAVQIHFDGSVLDKTYKATALPARKSGNGGVSNNDS
ncbi:MAG: hypothetical protein EON86_14250 [Brevundimonas sp.]|nr:MAG: hypothetical protein EON86_14250 [Brevundimonas sp.]